MSGYSKTHSPICCGASPNASKGVQVRLQIEPTYEGSQERGRELRRWRLDNTLPPHNKRSIPGPTIDAQFRDQPADLNFRVGHQFFVSRPDHPGWQHAMSQAHHATIATVGSPICQV